MRVAGCLTRTCGCYRGSARERRRSRASRHRATTRCRSRQPWRNRRPCGRADRSATAEACGSQAISSVQPLHRRCQNESCFRPSLPTLDPEAAAWKIEKPTVELRRRCAPESRELRNVCYTQRIEHRGRFRSADAFLVGYIVVRDVLGMDEAWRGEPRCEPHVLTGGCLHARAEARRKRDPRRHLRFLRRALAWKPLGGRRKQNRRAAHGPQPRISNRRYRPGHDSTALPVAVQPGKISARAPGDLRPRLGDKRAVIERSLLHAMAAPHGGQTRATREENLERFMVILSELPQIAIAKER